MARRSGLGRGLGALIPEAHSNPAALDGEVGLSGVVPTAPASSTPPQQPTPQVAGPFRTVSIDSIVANPFQPRKVIDDTALEPLAASIKELGVLQPILVRESGPDAYELIAGERRWRASKKAGLKQVPVIVKEAEDIHSLEQALVENLHRKDLNPIDEAAAYRQLIDDFTMTHDEVGKRVGKSRATISNTLRLLQLPPKAQKLLSDGSLTEGHARALLGTEDQAFQSQLAERVVKEGLSVRAVEDAIRLRNELANPAAKKRATAKVKVAPYILDWQERLSDRLDTKIAISSGAKRGKITIEFADPDDLDRICAEICDVIEEG